jgi:metal-responsive CopG/Arc/MetJ family transcriptional regulator
MRAMWVRVQLPKGMMERVDGIVKDKRNFFNSTSDFTKSALRHYIEHLEHIS